MRPGHVRSDGVATMGRVVEIEVVMRTIVPVWAESVRPHLWVDGRALGPIGTQPAVHTVDVDGPTVLVVVTAGPWVNGGIGSVRDGLLSPHVRRSVAVEGGRRLSLEYRSAPVSAWLLPGRLRCRWL